MGRAIRVGAISGTMVVVAALLLAFAGMARSEQHASALTNCTVADYSLDGEEQAFLGLINGYRQQNGLGALGISTNLNRAAAWMVNDLAANNYFSHTDSLGRSPYQRAIDCGYPSGAGENLAAGTAWDTAQAAFDAWKASPGHNANMVLSYYQVIGIARLHAPGSTYGWYWVTDFGASPDGGGSPPPTNTPANTPTATPTSSATPSLSGSSPTPTSSPSATSTPTSASPTSQPGATSSPTASPTSVPTSGATPAPPATNAAPPPAGSLPLSRGANLVVWPSDDTTPSQALGSMGSAIAIVYAWDPATNSWQRYGPALPSFANSITFLRRGAAYWVIATTNAQVPIH
jgi:uncharacterized protein YkwD